MTNNKGHMTKKRLPFAQTIKMQVQLIVVSLVTEW